VSRAADHHTVSAWSLAPFADADGLLWPLDIRTREIQTKNRPSPKRAGWIRHFNSVRDPLGAWDPWIEEWLAHHVDSQGATLRDKLIESGLVERADRFAFARVLATQMMRTPQGLEFVNETEPDGVALSRDERRERLPLMIDSEPWHGYAERAWRIVHPPDGEQFIISDNPVTSRLRDWPDGAASSTLTLVTEEGGQTHLPQITWPLSPSVCLHVGIGPAEWLPSRKLDHTGFYEINWRTALAADRWVWAADRGVLERLAVQLDRNHYESLYPMVGEWPR
jgi:Protein of unknown function (DUF4238)